MGEYIVPIIDAMLAASPGLYAIFYGRRKQSADAAEVYERIAQRTGEQMEGLRGRIDTLEEQGSLYERALEEVESEIAMYQRTLAEWREGIEKLLCQMKENNIDPVWMPPPESKEIPSRPRKAK